MADGETVQGDQTDRELNMMTHIVTPILRPHASQSWAHFSSEFALLSQDLCPCPRDVPVTKWNTLSKSSEVRGPGHEDQMQTLVYSHPAVRHCCLELGWHFSSACKNLLTCFLLLFLLLLFPESFAVSNRELCDDEKEFVHFPVCEGTSQPEPSCSAVRITANKNYRSKPPQEGALKKMHEEEHHQQMSILQLQLIQMNEVHVAKIQQIERECEMAEEEHRIKMEVLNKKKMYWERKLQTFTKEWPVSSFNRPFPNSP